MVTMMQWCRIEEKIKDYMKQAKNNKDDRMERTIKNMKRMEAQRKIKKKEEMS